MRRSTTAAAVVFVIAAATVAWYWASPYFAVAGLRNAALHKDTTALEQRVDFPRLRENVKTQFAALMMTKAATALGDNPFAALGAALAAKLADVMVDALVTPAGLVLLLEPHQETAQDVSGWDLMFSRDVTLHREALDAFAFSGTDKTGPLPVLRFAREGIHWRLVGIDVPKDLLTAEAGNAARGAQQAAPVAPHWELVERKNPMDDTVTVILSRNAEESVRTQFAAVRPTLIFRCRGGELEAYISVEIMVEYDEQTGTSEVRVRFDEAPAVRETWSVSTDREALFAPEPKELLAALRKASVLLFEWHQYGGSALVAKFAKGDLDAQVPKLAEACAMPELAR